MSPDPAGWYQLRIEKVDRIARDLKTTTRAGCLFWSQDGHGFVPACPCQHTALPYSGKEWTGKASFVRVVEP